jgi:hypothetical protein
MGLIGPMRPISPMSPIGLIGGRGCPRISAIPRLKLRLETLNLGRDR